MNIGILAPFNDFDESYSLSHVIIDQAKGLAARGHKVTVWVFGSCPPKAQLYFGPDIELRRTIHSHEMVPDEVRIERWSGYAEDIMEQIAETGAEVVISHDVFLQETHIDIACAIHHIADSCREHGVAWLHYLHSSVHMPATEPVGDQKWRRRIPDGHHLVYPNMSYLGFVSQVWDIPAERVHACPNPRDPRTFFRTSDLATKIIKQTDLLNKDVSQIYPFCVTRAHHKGVGTVVEIFSRMKAKGADVCLMLAAANANTLKARQKKAEVEAMGPNLRPGKDIVWLDTMTPSSVNGVANETISELFRFTNLFLFPTMGEACPLVLAEAGMSGNLCVVNRTVPSVMEYAPPNSLRYDFESWNAPRIAYKSVETDKSSGRVRVIEGNESRRLYLEQIADEIATSLDASPQATAKKYAFRMFNRDKHAERIEKIAELAISDR